MLGVFQFWILEFGFWNLDFNFWNFVKPYASSLRSTGFSHTSHLTPHHLPLTILHLTIEVQLF